MSENILLIECGSVPGCHVQMSLNESANKAGTKFRGKFQEAEVINKNRRRYPFSVLDENVRKLQETIEARGLIGELDHPSDSIIHFEKGSHVITKLWWEGNVLMGEGEVLPTPMGEILSAYLRANVRVGISSRGVGNGRMDENNVLVIGESYKLLTFDAVSDPSTPLAFQKQIKKENAAHAEKNESAKVHNVSKELVTACLGGIVAEVTGNIKRGLK